MSGQEPAKIKMAELMLRGMNWEAAARQAKVVTSRSSAYWFVNAYCIRGEKVLDERRQGHAHKVVGDVLKWLLDTCRETPEITAQELRTAIREHFGIRVSKSHLNYVRRRHGVSRPKKDERQRE